MPAHRKRTVEHDCETSSVIRTDHYDERGDVSVITIDTNVMQMQPTRTHDRHAVAAQQRAQQSQL